MLSRIRRTQSRISRDRWLAGLPGPEIVDNGSAVDERKARIAATVGILESVDPAAVEAGLTREVLFPRGKETITMTGED